MITPGSLLAEADAAAERLRASLTRARAALDEFERLSQLYRPDLERIRDRGPDGGPRDIELAKHAADYACEALDYRLAERRLAVMEAGVAALDEGDLATFAEAVDALKE